MNEENNNKKRAFEQMMGQIEEEIFSKKIKPNERLPSERMLQSKYNVARGTVREALRVLELKGLIEIKKGSKGGAFVREMSVSHMTEILSSLIHHRRIPIQHIAEFREIIESSTAAYATERATQEDIVILKRLFNKAFELAQNTNDHSDEFYFQEMRMHKELARISHNPLLEWILSTLTESINSYLDLVKDEKAPQEMLEDWVEIIKAIENGESMKAGSIIRAHIVRFRRPMEGAANLISLYEVNSTK